MSRPPQSTVSPPEKAHPLYLDVDQAVQYLRDIGLVTVTADTIRTHSYRTGKLPRPVVIGKPRRSYWRREDLDKLLQAL